VNSIRTARGGRGQRIAVIGTGVSGLVAARQLATRHDVTLLEAATRAGGHTHTVQVRHAGVDYAVDTGFIVFNDRTYPRFVELLDELGVEAQDTTMSFSVRCERSGLEYNGSTLDGLFAQRRNLLRPSFHRMLLDILRFNRHATEILARDVATLQLGDFLARERYSRAFIDHYLVPMGAAIWSCRPAAMLEFPAAFFVRFFANHGMLTIDDRPTWRVVRGGSRTYVDRILQQFRGRIRTGAAVIGIRRFPEHVAVRVRGAAPERYDAVVLATHSDTSLGLLDDASELERELLGAIPYQRNQAILHTDGRMLPRRRRAWAAWNYHIGPDPEAPVAVTYDMNTLQRLDAPVRFLVTLNRGDSIRSHEVLQTIDYSHPVFTPAGIAAQARMHEIDGKDRVFYCGAWRGFGFHEDGVRSGLEVGARFGVAREHAA
jgi:predicted NAD/FAD-binding protein